VIKVAIISTLKPTTEVRMYKRFAKTLAKTNKYEINIIGLAQKNTPEVENNIKHHPLINREKGTISRIKSWITIKKYLSEIGPKIIIITAPDQLIAIALFKKKQSVKVVYDIQEDYWKNIIYQRIYPFPINLFLGTAVRVLEFLSASFINHYILAEKIYEKDLSFVRKKFTILENKVVFDVNVKSKKKSINTIIFTGVISTYSGIESVMALYVKIKAFIPNVQLSIVGYAPLKHHVKYLKEFAERDEKISLIGIDHFVDHDTILSEIKNANIGIVAYENNKALKGKIPTKLYEYTYCGLPYLIDKASYLIADAEQIGGAILIDFIHPDLNLISNLFLKTNEMSTISVDHPSSWKHEELKFIKLIDDLSN